MVNTTEQNLSSPDLHVLALVHFLYRQCKLFSFTLPLFTRYVNNYRNTFSEMMCVDIISLRIKLLNILFSDPVILVIPLIYWLPVLCFYLNFEWFLLHWDNILPLHSGQKPNTMVCEDCMSLLVEGKNRKNKTLQVFFCMSELFIFAAVSLQLSVKNCKAILKE